MNKDGLEALHGVALMPEGGVRIESQSSLG